jgi:cytoskeletal protein RodZ
MFSLRRLIPSFEKPVERPRYLNIEPQRRDFRGIGTVLGLAIVCGIGFAIWEPSHTTSTPSQPGPRVQADAAKAAAPETTAAAEAEDDDQPAPTVKLSTACAQRPTARRDCAGVKAFKEARLKAPEPAAPKTAQAPAAVAKVASMDQAQPAPTASTASDITTAANAQAGVAAPPPQRTAAAPKAKRPRVQEEAPVERLVRVYDQVLPDGRRIPVYRRVGSGGFETGTIVDGEYRPTRRANLEQQGGRYFGLQ